MATVWKNMLTGRGGFIGGQNRASGAWVGLADYLITALEPWVSITSLSSIVSSWDIRQGGFIEVWMADHHYGDGLKLFTRVGKGRRTLPRLIKEQPVGLILREAILVEMSWGYGLYHHYHKHYQTDHNSSFISIIIIINSTIFCHILLWCDHVHSESMIFNTWDLSDTLYPACPSSVVHLCTVNDLVVATGMAWDDCHHIICNWWMASIKYDLGRPIKEVGWKGVVQPDRIELALLLSCTFPG